MRKIQEKFGTSLFLGRLPRGCQLCHSGSKIILFMTGLCEKPMYCKWYCPISHERRGNDLCFVNESEINSNQDIILEAELIDAEGAAITGGEPILCFDRTLKYIKLCKSVFGREFHIHLYTNAINLSKNHLKALKNAGLDEIRLHPSPHNWNKIVWCVESGIETGVEIPAIPYQFLRIKALISFLEKIGANFLNLNEFEITETNAENLKSFGFRLKENTIAAIEKSEELGLKLLEYAKPFNLNVHYCSIGYKDGVQLKKRYLRRAQNIKLPHESINEDGLLVKGIIYRKNMDLSDLKTLRTHLIQKFRFDESSLLVNSEKSRLEISIENLDEIVNYLKQINKLFEADNKFISGVIEELPLDGKNRIQMTFTPSETYK